MHDARILSSAENMVEEEQRDKKEKERDEREEREVFGARIVSLAEKEEDDRKRKRRRRESRRGSAAGDQPEQDHNQEAGSDPEADGLDNQGEVQESSLSLLPPPPPEHGTESKDDTPTQRRQVTERVIEIKRRVPNVNDGANTGHHDETVQGSVRVTRESQASQPSSASDETEQGSVRVVSESQASQPSSVSDETEQGNAWRESRRHRSRVVRVTKRSRGVYD